MTNARVSDMPEDKQEEAKNSINQLIDALIANGVELFHDQYQEPFISIADEKTTIFELQSPAFKHWLSHYCYTNGINVGSDILRRTTDVLCGKARFEGEEIPLEIRIRRSGQKLLLWYDLGNQVIGVNPKAWAVMPSPKIMFRRLQHQNKQVMPEKDGDIFDIKKFVNLPNEDDLILFIIYLITAFIPGYAHPLLILYGPPGSGKSTPFRILKELIDPSKLSHSLALPSNEKDFAHIAAKHYLLIFDNLSNISPDVSDILARACYGDGFSTRALYTNDDDFIRTYQPRIAINGINQVATRSDLLDRSLLIHLDRIPDDKRIDEEAFWRDFEKAKPKLLGAIFTALSNALDTFPKLPDMPKARMATFQLWGCAVAEAIGIPKEGFLKIYHSKINKQHEEAIEANVLALAIVALMQNQNNWSGSPTSLLEELRKCIQETPNIKVSGLPSNPVWLGRNIAYVETNLAAIGIKIEHPENIRPRVITLSRDANFAVGTDILSMGSGPTVEQQSFIELIREIMGPIEILKNIENIFDSDNIDSKDGNR